MCNLLKPPIAEQRNAQETLPGKIGARNWSFRLHQLTAVFRNINILYGRASEWTAGLRFHANFTQLYLQRGRTESRYAAVELPNDFNLILQLCLISSVLVLPFYHHFYNFPGLVPPLNPNKVEHCFFFGQKKKVKESSFLLGTEKAEFQLHL